VSTVHRNFYAWEERRTSRKKGGKRQGTVDWGERKAKRKEKDQHNGGKIDIPEFLTGGGKNKTSKVGLDENYAGNGKRSEASV